MTPLARDDRMRWISRRDTAHRKLVAYVATKQGHRVKEWRNGKPVIVVQVKGIRT